MCKLVNKQPTTPYPASCLTVCCIFSVTALKDGDCDKMFKAGNKIQNVPIYYNPFLFKGKKLLIRYTFNFHNYSLSSKRPCQLVTGLSLLRSGFDHGLVHVRFIVDEGIVKQYFSFPVSIIPIMLNTHTSPIYH